MKKHSKENISINERNLINELLSNYSNYENVKKMADKMNIDLAEMLYEKVCIKIDDGIKMLDEESIINNIVGILGNLYASMYFKDLGYDVENEKVIRNKESNKEDTKSDIYFKDKNNIDTFCEVKACFEIRYPKEKYVDKDEIDFSNIKYEQIGKKLLQQVEKLKHDNDNANVYAVVFNGCIIDDEIKNSLNKLNVGLKTIMIPISMIKNEATLIYEEFKKDYLNVSGKKYK